MSDQQLHRNRVIQKRLTLLDALKKMDSLDKKLLIVLDEEKKYVSLLSAGDIQRAIIQNTSLDTPIENILVRNVKISTPSDSFENIKKMMLQHRM